jgi:WhiB family redox-sensing transcriptional regulator
MTGVAFDAPLDGRPTWYARAACLGLPLGLFFADDGERTTHAQEVCRRCPVQRECLDYALTNGIRHGVWGGLSAGERRGLRSRSRRRRAEAAFAALRATAG